MIKYCILFFVFRMTLDIVNQVPIYLHVCRLIFPCNTSLGSSELFYFVKYISHYYSVWVPTTYPDDLVQIDFMMHRIHSIISSRSLGVFHEVFFRNLSKGRHINSSWLTWIILRSGPPHRIDFLSSHRHRFRCHIAEQKQHWDLRPLAFFMVLIFHILGLSNFGHIP